MTSARHWVAIEACLSKVKTLNLPGSRKPLHWVVETIPYRDGRGVRLMSRPSRETCHASLQEHSQLISAARRSFDTEAAGGNTGQTLLRKAWEEFKRVEEMYHSQST